MKILNLFLFGIGMLSMISCAPKNDAGQDEDDSTAGLKIVYINGDSILHNYSEFRSASENMEEKQRNAEEILQIKGAELEKEIMAYQRKAQAGILSRNEMEVQERRLGAKQQALLNERDQMTDSLLSETTKINDRLQKIIKEKLEEIKKQEGYDFILNYAEGGQILIADEKHDITVRVLEALNKGAGKDTMKKDSMQ